MAYSVLPIAGVDLNTQLQSAFLILTALLQYLFLTLLPWEHKLLEMMAFAMCLHKRVSLLRHQPLLV